MVVESTICMGRRPAVLLARRADCGCGACCWPLASSESPVDGSRWSISVTRSECRLTNARELTASGKWRTCLRNSNRWCRVNLRGLLATSGGVGAMGGGDATFDGSSGDVAKGALIEERMDELWLAEPGVPIIGLPARVLVVEGGPVPMRGEATRLMTSGDSPRAKIALEGGSGALAWPRIEGEEPFDEKDDECDECACPNIGAPSDDKPVSVVPLPRREERDASTGEAASERPSSRDRSVDAAMAASASRASAASSSASRSRYSANTWRLRSTVPMTNSGRSSGLIAAHSMAVAFNGMRNR